MKKCIKGILAAAAIAVGMFAATPSRANTIEPILKNITSIGGGLFDWNYDIILTQNNGLSGTFSNNAPSGDGSYASGLIMLDFQGLVNDVGGSNPNHLTFVGGDSTATTDWSLDTLDNLSGGTKANGGFETTILSPNWQNVYYDFGFGESHIRDSKGDNLASIDDPTLKNIVLVYKGAGVPVSTTGYNLIHLDLISNIGTFVEQGRSQSRDQDTVGLSQVSDVETFTYKTPTIGGLTFAPMPKSVWSGFGLLAVLAAARLVGSRKADLV